MMAGEAASPYDDYGYIKNGKYFHLDGIDKGETVNAWTDLVGGLVFATYGNVTELTNGWYLPKLASAYLCAVASVSDIPNNANATVEVCFQLTSLTSNGVILAKHNASFSPMFLIYSQAGQARAFNGSNQKYWNAGVQANNPYTISINADTAVSNGATLTLGSSTAATWAMEGQGDYMRIGSRKRGAGTGNGTDMCHGNVYAIRIYNRKLTTAEMTHNQQVDNERFNLGLTI